MARAPYNEEHACGRLSTPSWFTRPSTQVPSVCWYPLLVLWVFSLSLPNCTPRHSVFSEHCSPCQGPCYAVIDRGAQLSLHFPKITPLMVPSRLSIYKFSSRSHKTHEENWANNVRDNTDSRVFPVQTPLRKKSCPK